MEEHLLQGMRGIGAGRPSATFRIDHAVDQGDEQFGEHGRRDVDAKHAFLLSAQEEGVQRFQVGLPACAFAVRVEEVRAVLEYQEYQQLAVGEVFLIRRCNASRGSACSRSQAWMIWFSTVSPWSSSICTRLSRVPQKRCRVALLTPAASASSFSVARGRSTIATASALMSRSSWEIRVIDGSRLVFLIVRIVQKTGLASKGISCQKII